jgi:hypothetical protein
VVEFFHPSLVLFCFVHFLSVFSPHG